MAAQAERVRAVAALAAGAGLLGLAPIGLRLSDVDPQATAFWRFAFALPVLWILAARAGRDGAPIGPLAPMLLAAGVFFGLDIALWHASLALTTVTNATLLSNMTPLVAATTAWLLFRERIPRGFAAGAVTAFCGAGLLAWGRAQSGAGPAGAGAGTLGDLLALFSAVWYAGYLLLMGRARRTVNAWRAMAITTTAALAVAALATALMAEALWPHSLQGWAILVGLGLVVHVGGQGLIAVGLGRLPIAVSAVVLWIQPVVAAIMSWVLFGEALGPISLAGAALILAGVYWVQRQRA